MKDLKRLLIYGGSAALMVFVLSELAASGRLSGNLMVGLAILVVVILPVALGVLIGKQERKRNAASGK